jgi:hypothetical protein
MGSPITLNVSDLRLLDAPGFSSGNKDEWDLCSKGCHRGKNCQAIFFTAFDF